MLNNQSFKAKTLQRAIETTFKHRRTDINDAEYIFSAAFYEDGEKEKMWAAFFRKNNLKKTETFASVVAEIKNFLMPIVGALLVNQSKQGYGITS